MFCFKQFAVNHDLSKYKQQLKKRSNYEDQVTSRLNYNLLLCI